MEHGYSVTSFSEQTLELSKLLHVQLSQNLPDSNSCAFNREVSLHAACYAGFTDLDLSCVFSLVGSRYHIVPSFLNGKKADVIKNGCGTQTGEMNEHFGGSWL